jgi:hypothetical protein
MRNAATTISKYDEIIHENNIGKGAAAPYGLVD